MQCLESRSEFALYNLNIRRHSKSLSGKHETLRYYADPTSAILYQPYASLVSTYRVRCVVSMQNLSPSSHTNYDIS